MSDAKTMLADPNYPSEFEWASLIKRQADAYDRKMVVNLKAMLEEARAGAEHRG